MNTSRTSRFLLSTFTTAFMLLAWTGASRADLWVAQGVDINNNPVLVDINVVISQVQVDVMPYLRDQVQITISNLSPEGSKSTSDLVLETNNPLSSAFITFPMGSVLSDWNQAFNANTLTMTAQAQNSGTTGGDDTIASGQSASFTITTDNLNMEVGGVKISSQDGGSNEITATLASPEPSSIVIATFSALGFLGYSLRRRKAKLTAVAV